MLRLFLEFVRNNKVEAFLISGCLLFQAALSLLEPWPMQGIFDYVVLGKEPPNFLKALLPPKVMLLFFAGSMIVIALFTGLALVGQNILLNKSAQELIRGLRLRTFAHLLNLPPRYFQSVGPGEIISRVVSDTENLQPLVEGGGLLIFRSIPTALGILALMLIMDPLFALIVVLIVPALAISTNYFSGKIKDSTKHKRKHESTVVALTETATRTLRCLKVLGLSEYEIKRFEKFCGESARAGIKAGLWEGFYSASVNLILAVGTVGVVVVGVWRIKAGRISPGELLVFISYLRNLYKPINEFTKYLGKFSKASASLDRIYDVLKVTPCDMGVCEAPNAVPAPPFKEELRFENVSFGYRPEEIVLKNISFTVKKGEKIAIVGDSGSGKSTLLNLIPRFIDPTKGRILMDGRDIREFTLASLRKNIAIVPQDHVIFHATVLENIALGSPERVVTREEVVKAAIEANAHEFIMQLPHGYDTMLGHGGVELSGGQAKRIHIARALLRDAPIILLDEPTAGLDPCAEGKVMEAFDRLMYRRTILIVTHHLPLIANADRIIVLRNGSIAEEGTHEELLKAKGIYRTFWFEQLERALPRCYFEKIEG